MEETEARKTATDAAALAVVAVERARDVAAKASEGMVRVEQELQRHSSSDELHFQKIDAQLELIKTNHLHHIEKDVSTIAASMGSLHEKLDANTRETTENKTNLGWVVKIGGGAWAVVLVLFASMVYIVREALTK